MIHLPGRKPNYTSVARHFNKTKPISERHTIDFESRHPNKETPLQRLSFGRISGKEEATLQGIHRSIMRNTLPELILFPDMNFITNSLPEWFWNVFAARSTAFTQMTVAELSGWRAYPMHNAYLHSWLPRGLDQCAAEIAGGRHELFGVTRVMGSIGNELHSFNLAIGDRKKLRQFGYDYYVNMLAVRKLVGIREHRSLTQELGREPTEPEFHNRLNKKYQNRVAPLAFKGWKDRGKKNYLADEELVVTAVLSSILTKRETMILTWDTDLFEQFIKLNELLISDYLCFRFAEVRHFNPEGCPMFPMAIPKERQAGPKFFLGESLDHIVISEKDVQNLPPIDYHPVNTYCLLLGNNRLDPRLSSAIVCLEHEMVRMLDVKTKTGGMNTAYFPGRDVTIGTQIKDGRIGTLFTLSNMKFIEVEGIKITEYDLFSALKSDELYTRSFFYQA